MRDCNFLVSVQLNPSHTFTYFNENGYRFSFLCHLWANGGWAEQGSQDVRTGSLIGLGFGWLWWLAGTGVVAGFPGSVLQVLGILIFALSGIWIVKRRPQAAHRQPRWAFYVGAILVEIAAIALAQAWLTARGLEPLLFPVIGIIVGLHFTGLWPAFGRRRFLVLAGAMMAINLLALLLPLEPGTRLMLSGFGSSACLLATALLP
ncbi:hypothetical protein BH09BAC4_BH09BAC4_51310 [soil metagenome]